MGPNALSSFWPLAVCVARVKKKKKRGLLTEEKNNLARHRATIFNIQDKTESLQNQSIGGTVRGRGVEQRVLVVGHCAIPLGHSYA